MTTAVVGAAARQQAGLSFQTKLLAVTVAPWVLLTMAHLAGADLRVGAFAALTFVATAHVGTTAAFYFDGKAHPVLNGQPVRFFLMPAMLVVGGVVLATQAPSEVLGLAIAGLLLWQIHHFTRQNLGVFSFLCKSRSEAGPSPIERRIIDLTGYAGMCGMVGKVTDKSSLMERAIGPASELFMLAGVGLLGAGAVLLWLHREGMSPVRVFAMGSAVAFYLPLFLYPGQFAVSALIYGAAHSAQYYLMMLELRGGRDARASRNLVGTVLVAAVTLGAFYAWAGTGAWRSSTASTWASWRRTL